FSCRRRHTRFSRDWSSDVCSSDLTVRVLPSSSATWSIMLTIFFFRCVELLGRGSVVIYASASKQPFHVLNVLQLASEPMQSLRRSEERRVGKEVRYGCSA